MFAVILTGVAMLFDKRWLLRWNVRGIRNISWIRATRYPEKFSM